MNFVETIKEQKSSLFTQKNKADLIPYFANVFLEEYLPEKCNIFPEGHAIKLLEHLCLWLQQRKYTSWKLVN